MIIMAAGINIANHVCAGHGGGESGKEPFSAACPPRGMMGAAVTQVTS